MIFVDSLVDFPLQVDGSNWLADYWYCLVRAMGRFALQEHSTLIWIVLDCASRHPLPSMREAAIEAFGEVGDERSMRRLNEIAHNDKMPAMRNFAREILNEICE